MIERAFPGSRSQLLRVALILQLLGSYLWGLDPQIKPGQYLVNQWEMADGIPSNTILAINQTPDGYLWIGTFKGLVRFDGIKFFSARFGEKNAIYSHETRCLTVDKDGTLWIGSSGGLTSYRFRSGEFKTFTKDDGITLDGIRRIEDDRAGNLWISFTSSYVNRYTAGRFTVFNAAHGLSGKRINAILEDGKGNLWFASREEGIFAFKEEKFSRYAVPGLENLIIVTMLEARPIDGEGEIWIGTNKGLFRVTGGGTRRFTTMDGLTADYISDILEDSDRNLWVSTIHGLNRVKKTPGGNVGFERVLPSFSINCLFEDREKSLWVGTDTSGLLRLKDGKFTSYEPLEPYPLEVPSSLYEDRNGDTWIGTAGGKLFRCRGSKVIESLAPTELAGTGIAAIAEDGQGFLWLGTIGKGAIQKQGGTFLRYTTREGLADNLVTSIFKDSRDNLWFATFDGVSRLRPGSRVLESFKSTDGLAGKVVHNIYESKTGDIWVAADQGITILKKISVGGGWQPNVVDSRKEKLNKSFLGVQPRGAGSLRRSFGPSGESLNGDSQTSPPSTLSSSFITHNSSLHNPPLGFTEPKAILPGVSVTCINEDGGSRGEAGGVFWIATQGAGLIRFQEGKCFSFTTDNGMGSNFLYQFMEDRQGYFWFMSDSGILRVAKSELERLAGDDALRLHCTFFGISDGMKSLEFDNVFSRNSALQAGNGEFRFITKKGIAVVNPEKIRIDKTPPPVVIEEVSLDGRLFSPHGAAKPLTFKGIDEINFHFTAPTFLSPGQVGFKYRLERVDREWVYPGLGQERSARYRDLDPGTYTFRVTACNPEGVWNPTGESVTFTLEPSFHQTFVFKAAVLFLLIFLGVGAFYLYKKILPGKKEKYKGIPLNPDFAGECIKKLKSLMEVEKLYCDAGLTLQSLAERMSVTAHQLSQLLNEKLDRNFADFINGYRIEEVKRLLKGPRGVQQKIDVMAHEVGFNTMVAFYRAFKKFTGTTPTKYRVQGTGRK